MSRVIVSVGSLRNSSHVQFLSLSTSPVIENVQSVSGVRGVGPADRTGKSCTRYWPGGRLPSGAWSLGRPWNARETKVMIEPPPVRRQGQERPCPHTDWSAPQAGHYQHDHSSAFANPPVKAI